MGGLSGVIPGGFSQPKPRREPVADHPTVRPLIERHVLDCGENQAEELETYQGVEASYASTARKLHQDRGRIHPVSAHARVGFYGTLLEATTCFAKLVRRIGVSSTIYEDLLESSDVGAAFRRRIRSDHII